MTHLFLSDEEIGSPTSRPLIERLARESKVVLVTEPAREGGKVVTARKGVARYDLETFGVASHAGSRHEDGRNAIAEMCRQILKLEAMTDYRQWRHRQCRLGRRRHRGQRRAGALLRARRDPRADHGGGRGDVRRDRGADAA